MLNYSVAELRIYNFKAVCYFVCQNKLLLLPFETKVSG